jgi:glycosyltransferase involved in cell wall biosynthesis
VIAAAGRGGRDAVARAAGSRLRAVLFEGTSYSWPLSPSHRKQFHLMSELAAMFDVAFAKGLRFHRGRDHAEFYLLPRPTMPIGRYAVMLLAGTATVLWLVLARGVQVIVAKRPWEGFAGACVKRFAQLLGRRVVLIVENRGDFEVFVFLQRRVRWPAAYRWLMRRTAAYALREADLLRAVSGSSRRQLETWGCRQPIVVAPDWTDLDVFWAAGDAGGPRARGQLLYVGALVPRKGVDHLIEALALVAPAIPTVRLALVGAPENRAFARALAAAVDRLGLSSRVSFEPPLEQGELARRMAQAELFVLPTLAEGLPRVVLEAMAAGTPVLASAVSGIPEVVEHGETGLLTPPRDPRALAERIRWALTHGPEMTAMAGRARALVRRLDPLGSHVAGYVRLFEQAQSLLADWPGGGATR